MKVGIIYNTGDFKKAFPHDHKGRNSFFDDVKSALIAKAHEVIHIPANEKMFEIIKNEHIEIFFNAADEGYNMNTQLEAQIPAVLDIIGIPYTGSNYLTLGLCLDKVHTKQLLQANRLPTPRFMFFSEPIDSKSDCSGLRFPLIVKPSREDGSIGIKHDSVVDTKKELIRKVNEVLEKYKQPVLVEEFINGREVNIGIIGRDNITILPPSEIIFNLSNKHRNFLPYEAKWEEDTPYYTGTMPQCPAKIDSELLKRLNQLAEKAYRLFSLKDYGRVDFRISEENEPYILEVNPNPDISKDAGLARMAKAHGLNYDDLIHSIVLSTGVNKKAKIKGYIGGTASEYTLEKR
jgi:D-alanine-D-alanine ligase